MARSPAPPSGSIPTPPRPPVAVDAAWLRHQQRLDQLRELAELMMNLAAAIGREAAEGEWPRRHTGAMQERLARSARRCVALSTRLDAAFVAQASGEPRRAAKPMKRAARERLKSRIGNCVAVALATQVDRPSLSGLVANLHKRLKEPEMDDDLLDQPIGEIMASFCREFGVKADMSGLTREELGLGRDAMRKPATPRQ